MSDPVMGNVGITKTLILGGAILFSAVAAHAGEPVRVRVPTSALMAPADLRIYIVLERHAENRLLRVSAESSDFFRSSDVQLDGEGSARVTILNFRDLPPGSYDVKAEVIGADGRKRGSAHCWVTIL
jgi:hypothetical protein